MIIQFSFSPFFLMNPDFLKTPICYIKYNLNILLSLFHGEGTKANSGT